MIQNGEGYHYFAVKKLSALLRGTAKLHDDFYILKRLHSFETEKKCESHKTVWGNKNFCSVEIASEDTTKILEFNQYGKSPIYCLCRS